MDAWSRTGDSNYLSKSKMICRFMMTAFDTAAGGGLYWEEGNLKTKNTCSNGPGILLAMQLHKATGEKAYLDTAMLLYNWVNRHLQAPDGLYYDNISLNNRRIDHRKFSYNTGTMLQSNLWLYEATGNAALFKKCTTHSGCFLAVFLQLRKVQGQLLVQCSNATGIPASSETFEGLEIPARICCLHQECPAKRKKSGWPDG